MDEAAIYAALRAQLVMGDVPAVATVARADRTFLAGGGVIEGKATRKAGRVLIEVEAGEIALPAEAVTRIVKSESTVPYRNQ